MKPPRPVFTFVQRAFALLAGQPHRVDTLSLPFSNYSGKAYTPHRLKADGYIKR